MKKLFIALGFVVAVNATAQKPFDIQGHRGAMGLYPENSIMGFIKAIDMGVTTLELDLAVTNRNELVVSHEPWVNADLCKTAQGKSLNPVDTVNIYKIDYATLATYDCGSTQNVYFNTQKTTKTNKPLLSAVIDTAEAYTKARSKQPINYNIEIKTMAKSDGIYHPAPAEFARLLIEMINQKGIADRVIIQSFDVRALQAVKEQAPKLKLALLVGEKESVDGKENQLGFKPDILSPKFSHINKKLVKQCHDKGQLIIPWTVDDYNKMKEFIALGVDGIITNYPDRLVEALEK